MICAIHQPNFFPWYGYFNKIIKADIFVFLDDVQVVKKGSSYVNRVAFNINGESKNFTAPINKEKGFKNINESHFVNNNWREKLKSTLQTNYAKSKNFNTYKNTIFEIIDDNKSNISSYNISAITKLCKILNIKFEYILSSTLDIKTTSTLRLIDICKKVEADTYLFGAGAKNYQENKLFKENNVKLLENNYKIIEYKQNNSKEFINGLSILDYIFQGL